MSLMLPATVSPSSLPLARAVSCSAVACLVFALVACGGKEGGEADTTPSAVVAGAKDDAAQAPAPAEGDAAQAPAPANGDAAQAPAPAEGDTAATSAASEADSGSAAPAPGEGDADVASAGAMDDVVSEPADSDAARTAADATEAEDGGLTMIDQDAAPPAPKVLKTFEIGASYDEFKIDAIAVALSSDGRYLASGDLGGRLSVWDTQSKRLLIQDTLPEGNRVHRVSFAAAAPVLVSGTFGNPDAPFRLWQVKPAGPRHTLGREGWQVVAQAVDAPGAQLLALMDVGGGKLKLMLWGIDDAEERFMTTLLGDEAQIALSGDGGTAAISDSGGFIHIYRGSPWAEVFSKRFEGATAMQRLLLSRDGTGLWGAEGRRVHRYDLGETPALVASRDVDEAGAVVRGLEALPDGRAVAVTRPEPGGLRLWDAISGTLVVNVASGCRCESHALSADGRSLACDCVPEAVVRVWRLPEAP